MHFASNSAEIQERDKEKLDRLYESLSNNSLSTLTTLLTIITSDFLDKFNCSLLVAP